MHCKKCLHYEVCVKLGKPSLYGINQEIGCSSYKDNTMIMEDVKKYTPYLDCQKHYKVHTNADRFRSMSDDEQQNFVRGFWEIEDFADWLEQSHKGE